MQTSCRNCSQYSRFDADSALVVERGIALQHKAGNGFAAAYMKAHHIHTSVILRVLLRPAERRARPATA